MKRIPFDQKPKTTIEEAFKHHRIIDIQWKWTGKVCSRIDEEYSFHGTFGDFKEKLRNYDCMDFDTEITHMGGNRYRIEEHDPVLDTEWAEK